MGFLIEKSNIIGAVIIFLLIIHAAFGKPRWQIIPIYVSIGIYFLSVILINTDLINLANNIEKWILGIIIFLIFISVVSLIILPLDKIPVPSGNYLIGTKSYDLVDTSRKAVYSDELDKNRKIKFQVWYPTDAKNEYEKGKWIEDGYVVTRQLAKSMHLPFFVLDHTALIKSNSYKDTPISSDFEKYPIVIISHGWLGFRELHTDFAEELASNGYIAISIDHTYGSQGVKFENGDVAYLKEEALPDADSTSNFAKHAKKLVETYGKDVISVLDELEVLNKSEDFREKLDLSRIGLLGHSTGGGGDVYASLKDNRVKAVLGLDAWVIPIESEFKEFQLSIPSRFIRSNQWASFPNNKSIKSLVGNSVDSKLLQIDGTRHVDFTMAYMYSPISKLVGFLGDLENRKASKIQRDFILSFFDEYFKDVNKESKSYSDNIIEKYKELRSIDLN